MSFQDHAGIPFSDQAHPYFGRCQGLQQICFAVSPHIALPSSPIRFAYDALESRLDPAQRERLSQPRSRAKRAWRQFLSTSWGNLTEEERDEAIARARKQYDDDDTAELTRVDTVCLRFWQCHHSHNEEFGSAVNGVTLPHFLDCVQWDPSE